MEGQQTVAQAPAKPDKPAKGPFGTTAPRPKVEPTTTKKAIDDYFGGQQAPPEEPKAKPATEPEPLVPAQPPEPPADQKEPTPTEDKKPGEAQKPSPAEELLADISAKPAQPDERLAIQDKLEGPKQLREAYQKLKEEHAKVKSEYESRIEELERANKKLAEELKYAEYTKSPEYRAKYVEPLQKRIENAYKLVQRLPVTAEDRLGKPEDINELFAMWSRNPHEAITNAHERFDNAAQLVIDQIAAIAEANEEATKAAEQFKREYEETLAKKRVREKQIWEQTIEREANKRPDLFKFDDDAELKRIADKYASYAEIALLGSDDLSDDELTEIKAIARNMIVAFGPLAHDRARLQAKVKELENELEQYRQSSPKAKAGDAAGTAKPVKKDAFAKLEDYFS